MTFPLLRRFRRVIADRHACDSLKHGQRPTELLRDYAGANALALQMRQLALGVAGSVAELALGVAGSVAELALGVAGSADEVACYRCATAEAWCGEKWNEPAALQVGTCGRKSARLFRH
jgi:hypothetical protein